MSLATHSEAAPGLAPAPAGIIDFEAVRRARYSPEPYPFVMAEHVLEPAAIEAIRRDFPDIREPGFWTIDQVPAQGAFLDLVRAMESHEFAAAMSDAIGFDLTPYPRYTTVRKVSAAKDGRIHTDGPGKVATALIYLNDESGGQDSNSGGRFRILRGPKDFDDYAAEVPPTMGAMVCFLRGENSWHGHKPFVGERRVLQMAWLKSAEDAERKSRNHRRSHFLKRLWPFGRETM